MKFWFHYNKPASIKAGEPRITVHVDGACRIVSNVHCWWPTKGLIRKKQPYFVMAGRCDSWYMAGETLVLR